MQVISVSVRNGVKTSTLDEGDWTYERTGWAGPWTATHPATETVIETGTSDIDDAKRTAREQCPALFPAPAPLAARYTVESRFDRRFASHRSGGETR